MDAKTEKGQRVQFSFRIDPDVRRQLRRMVAEDDISQSEVINRALRLLLEMPQQKEAS